jgi:hypothetical protein
MAETNLLKLAVNPFDDDIVKEPRDIPVSVLGLNDAPLQALSRIFANLERTGPRGEQVKATKAQLVISPDRGYGKSHLLGRLFETLDRRATRIYLRPFQDIQKCWHSILLQTVQELERTEGPGLQNESNPTQISAFADGVISGLTNLRTDDKSEPWFKWIRNVFRSRKDLQRVAAKLRATIPNLHGRHEAWLRVLYGYAFSPEHDPKRTIALKWIQGEPLEPDEAEALGLATADNDAKAEMTPAETNELSFRRLAGLCRLAGFYRPFLFCFDQTEFYGTNPELIRMFGNCIEKMFAELPNQLTVVTANQANWTEQLRPGIEQAHWDRFGFPIELESITSTLAKELIRNRLLSVGLDFRQVEEFYGPTWLSNLFQSGRMSVRNLLQHSAQRLRELQGSQRLAKKEPKVRIDDLFNTQVNLVKSKAALQNYNQDTLIWFSEELANGVNGIRVQTVKTNKWFSTRWLLKDKPIYFAFEGGDGPKRWKVIANEAINLAEKDGAKKLIVFRTPDLSKVPRPNWKNISPIIDRAVTLRLDIHLLDLASVCEIHAARDLYSDALEGNLDAKSEDVFAWLKNHFAKQIADLCSITSSSAPKPKPSFIRFEPGVPIGLSHHQKTQILRLIELKQFVSADDIIHQLKLSVSVELLLKEIQGAPIKTFAGPETVVIQWCDHQPP